MQACKVPYCVVLCTPKFSKPTDVFSPTHTVRCRLLASLRSILVVHLFKLLHHILGQGHGGETLHGGHVDLGRQSGALSYHLLHVLKVTHIEARGHGANKDGFFFERVTELVRETDGYGDEFARAGVQVFSAWNVEANFAFLPRG